jgi:hypothetical protein
MNASEDRYYCTESCAKMRRIDSATPGDEQLQEGLYKVEFHTAHGTGSVCDLRDLRQASRRQLRLCFHRPLQRWGTSIQVKVLTERHNEDPAFKPLFGTDGITLTLKGREEGHLLDFEGTALQLPGVSFRAILTRISD